MLHNLLQHFSGLVDATLFVFSRQGAHAHGTRVKCRIEQVRRLFEVGLGISLPSLAWSHPSNSSKALTASANTRYPFDLSMFGWLSYPFDLSIFGWLSSCRKNDGLLFVQALVLSVNCPKQNADGQCQHPVPFRRLNIWVAIKVPEK